MISSTRSAATLALRGKFPLPIHTSQAPFPSPQLLIYNTAKPVSSLIPYRSIAAISSTAAKPATAVSQHNASSGAPMSVTGKERREVLLPSQEGKKGVMQYALYVSRHPHTHTHAITSVRQAQSAGAINWRSRANRNPERRWIK